MCIRDRYGDDAVARQGSVAVIGGKAKVAVIHKQVLGADIVAQLQLDIGIALVKGNIKLRHIGGGCQHQELDIAKGFVGQLTHLRHRVVNEIDALVDFLVKDLSCAVQENGAVTPVKQGGAQFLFQGNDRFAQGRLGDHQFGSRLCHILMFCHHTGVAELQQFHSNSSLFEDL